MLSLLDGLAGGRGMLIQRAVIGDQYQLDNFAFDCRAPRTERCDMALKQRPLSWDSTRGLITLACQNPLDISGELEGGRFPLKRIKR